LTRALGVVIPVLNDWECLDRLLAELVAQTDRLPPLCVVVVDDGSTASPTLSPSRWGSHIRSLTVVHLGSSLGHQRAIAVGLACALDDPDIAHLLVMDADGEDDPASVPSLFEAVLNEPGGIAVAQRGTRSESAGFRFGYRVYKSTFRWLTGKTLDFGNFCLMRRDDAERLAYMPETWNHFAAAVMRSRLPLNRVRVDRRGRYAGTSRMNTVALVNHGLSAIAAFIDVVFTRLLAVVTAAIGLTLVVAGVALAIRLLTSLAIPGWATTVLGFAFLALVQFLGLLAVLTFVVLASRSEVVPVPIRVAGQYVKSVESVV
jgi:hypothetical protein